MLWAFFTLEFEGLFQNNILFSKKLFSVFQQGHCFSKDSSIFEGTELIFDGALGFFVGGKTSLFNEIVGPMKVSVFLASSIL